MKYALAFIIRLSILNFLFYLLAVGFIAKYNETPVKREIQNVISGSPSQVPVSSSLPRTKDITDPSLGVRGEPSPTPKAVNLFSELKNHNSKSDCWIAYSGHIYDITPFFGSHPGGDAIMLPYCGQDATGAFDGIPHPHSGNAKGLLQQYLVQ
jgi:cytochrome b involved in lipid metabolism